MPLEIHQATSPEDIAACLDLRREVFIVEQNVPESLEVDGLDGDCIHFLALEDKKPCSAARVRFIDNYAKIQRVCVPSAMRGTGLGRHLMEFIVEFLKHDGRVKIVRLESQTHALAFYEKLGFMAYGNEFMDAGIPHRSMEIQL